MRNILPYDYAQKITREKRASLHYSPFDKNQRELSTTSSKTIRKNRHPQSRIAEVGLVEDKAAPPGLNHVEGAFPGLQVRWAEDSGTSGVAGVNYKLRWETLEANRDRRPEGLLPPPSTLQLVTFKAQ